VIADAHPLAVRVISLVLDCFKRNQLRNSMTA
jgi:hypothetical protein